MVVGGRGIRGRGLGAAQGSEGGGTSLNPPPTSAALAILPFPCLSSHFRVVFSPDLVSCWAGGGGGDGREGIMGIGYLQCYLGIG